MKISARLVFGFVAMVALQGWGNAVDDLRSANLEVRRDAIDRVQTMSDPRIPEACLPLLEDAGLSIRRQAARAIGSRADQIPAKRRPIFVAALRKCAQQSDESTALVIQRSIGLLTRDYRSPAFSVSPNGRWVLYEQRRRPMILDTRERQHQLLAPRSREPWFESDKVVKRGELISGGKKTKLLKLMVTNESATELFANGPEKKTAHWHPKSRGLAFTLRLQARFYVPICLWRARDGQLTVWSASSFRKFFGKPQWGTTTEFVRWSGDRAIIRIFDEDSAAEGDPFNAKGVFVWVDLNTNEVGLESNSK
jgi:hypothetical protein